MSVSKEFIDLDLSKPPHFDLGKGCIDQDADQLMAALPGVPYFADEYPELMVPRSQWKDRAEALKAAGIRQTTRQIRSQGREGSCVGASIAQGIETKMSRDFGLAYHVGLSGMSIYRRIGRTAQSGAYIPDGIDAVVKEGCLPLPEYAGDFPHTHPMTGFGKALQPGWQATGKQFRVTKVARCRGVDEAASAMLARAVAIVGRQGHAIPYVYLDFDSNVNPVWCYANSWDVDWGDQGFGYDSERIVRDLTLFVILEVTRRPGIEIPEISLSAAA